MKISVSSEDLNLATRIAQRFGISPYLIIVDLETILIRFIYQIKSVLEDQNSF